ncbi:HpcH/HpaI aldolase/citrate lyase family protein [Paracoccus seriniphilus]|uniref:Citrate lyase subunit beta / citryl-CoA lyase n=1 Tax=Paracoccus seriniphilus TaxID=184748 RepID=A0A239Q287_9RHOB|nr:CoA ester lyase [Paracoccus seriniphilus]WCR15600.1 CoA ester lyase [Paracoccus seriniphilus]SNT76624.1 citrate lyase subunit beta / citryl-CoA lyase [Paracoccus seriniphilus]
MVALDLIRAPLFVPANRPERFAKAAASQTDAVILDLEDAVGPEQKDKARSQLRCDFTQKPVLVRVNACGTPWHEDDMAAISTFPFAGIILPKAEDPMVGATLSRAGARKMPLFPLIETARGLAQARNIAAHAGVQRLVFGSIDFCADLGCEHRRKILLPARSELVLASRLAGRAGPIDGVTARLDDCSEARTDAEHACALGMTGKLCIHPRQVPEVLLCFAPSAWAVDWARRVLDSGDGAVALDGAMIDEPVRLRARQIIAAMSKG